jgi:hypothetical protein
MAFAASGYKTHIPSFEPARPLPAFYRSFMGLCAVVSLSSAVEALR